MLFASLREFFRLPRLKFATNLRARTRRASTRFVTRQERAAFLLVPMLALSPAFSFFVLPFFGQAILVFSERPFKHLRPTPKRERKQFRKLLRDKKLRPDEIP